MIPKIIHYCWFGRGEKPALMKKCIKSWKKYCPDYEIIEWNEDNFDIDSCLWTKQAYEAKKYAFVSDYVRLYVLKKYGGIYMDTDQELIKPLDAFLHHKFFIGFTCGNYPNTGVIGSIADSNVTNNLFKYYDDRVFIKDGQMDCEPNTDTCVETLKQYGLELNGTRQSLEELDIYPSTYFCPTSCLTVENCISDETVAIHHFAMTWRSEKGRRDMKRQKFHSTKFYRIYEQIAAYPIALYKKIFRK